MVWGKGCIWDFFLIYWVVLDFYGLILLIKVSNYIFFLLWFRLEDIDVLWILLNMLIIWFFELYVYKYVFSGYLV